MENEPTEIRISMAVLKDERLTSTSKLILGMVQAGLDSTHAEMARILKVTDKTIRVNARRLKALGYLAETRYKVSKPTSF